MRASEITRKWIFDGKDHVLKDAAGHVIAQVWYSELDCMWQGYIPPREGRPDRAVVADARSSDAAKRAVEGELAGIRSCASERELIAVRAASPIRPLARKTDPVDGLALFDAARSPALL